MLFICVFSDSRWRQEWVKQNEEICQGPLQFRQQWVLTCPKNCDVTLLHDVIKCHQKVNLLSSTHQKLWNHVYQHGDHSLWPMTLTFKPIWDIAPALYIKHYNWELTLSNRQTHTQTRPILYPPLLTRRESQSVWQHTHTHQQDWQN